MSTPTPIPATSSPAPAAAAASGAAPLQPASGSPALRRLFAVSVALVLAAVVLDNVTLAHATTDTNRLLVRLGSAFALAAVAVGGLWLRLSPAPRRLRWLWFAATVVGFIYAMFEYGARGR